MKIKIDRCSCHCGGKWAILEVEPHGAEVMIGCLCHSFISSLSKGGDVELVNSNVELLEIIQSMMLEFNQLSQTSRQLFESLDTRLLKVEQKTDTNIMHDDPQHSRLVYGKTVE